MNEPIPFYPDLRCWQAPLREGHTPREGCECRVCLWARDRASGIASEGPVKPGTPQWRGLLALAGVQTNG